MNNAPFWIVWCPTGTTPPRVRFDNEAGAVKAAEDLARRNPGQQFYTLRAVALSVKRDVDTERLGDPSEKDIPF